MDELEKIFVVPVEGGLVRYPENRFMVMPSEGAFVPDNPYWRRRIMHGDVILQNEKKGVSDQAVVEAVQSFEDGHGKKSSKKVR